MSANFNVDASLFDVDGYVDVTWDDSNKDLDFFSWRVYRREPDEDWELLFETTSSASSFSYKDYLAPANTESEYSVVQTTDGGQEETAHDPEFVTPQATNYWLIHPTDSQLSMRLHNVTSDSFEEEFEEELIPLIGRGRKLDQGTRIGVTGSLSAQLRDKPDLSARKQAKMLRDIKAGMGFLWLRNPFGDVWKVSLSGMEFARLSGVGIMEFLDFSTSYHEVG